LCNNLGVSKVGVGRSRAGETRELLDSFGTVIRQLTRLTGGPDEGPAMTATQRLALVELVTGGPLRLSELAARLGVTAPTASRAVDALVELALVERLPDPADRRAVQIDVTAAGRARFEERHARVSAAFEPAVGTLSTAERAQLVELLGRLAAELSRPDA
jgi:DNA-binding MarR family transcriptional regulator